MVVLWPRKEMCLTRPVTLARRTAPCTALPSTASRLGSALAAVGGCDALAAGGGGAETTVATGASAEALAEAAAGLSDDFEPQPTAAARTRRSSVRPMPYFLSIG